MHRYSLLALILIIALSLTTSNPAAAGVITQDFESAPGSGYDLFFGAAWSTAQSHSTSHSILLPLTNGDEGPVVRIIPTSLTLGNAEGTFWGYVDSSSSGLLPPYMYFGVDTDQDNVWDGGVNDSLVIAFNEGAVPASITANTWFQSGLTGSTKVHVVGGRPGLTAGTYSSSGTQDTLANLRNLTVSGTTTWGDLNLLRIYVSAGEWPGVTNYTGYVDDISVIPGPAGLGLLALAGCIARRRRR